MEKSGLLLIIFIFEMFWQSEKDSVYKFQETYALKLWSQSDLYVMNQSKLNYQMQFMAITHNIVFLSILALFAFVWNRCTEVHALQSFNFISHNTNLKKKINKN